MTSKNANLNDTLGSTLDSLPGGSSVAVLDFLGSLCPITTATSSAWSSQKQPSPVKSAVECARREVQAEFGEVLATINVNGDFHVRSKLKSKGEASLSCAERQHLCELATADVPWIREQTAARPISGSSTCTRSTPTCRSSATMSTAQMMWSSIGNGNSAALINASSQSAAPATRRRYLKPSSNPRCRTNILS